MGKRVKDCGPGAYCLSVYDRSVPTEGFEFLARRRFEAPNCQLEAWILHGGHLLRFRTPAACVCELLTPVRRRRLLDGQVGSIRGETDGDLDRTISNQIRYLGTLEPDIVESEMFDDQWNEILECGRQPEALAHRWLDAGDKWLSVVEVQRRRRELHVGCYHLHAPSRLVMRTQTIFELLGAPVAMAGRGPREA